MITPVSALSGFLPDIVSTFSSPSIPEFSFEDSSWKKYASPVLQVARVFSPSLDMLMIGSELATTMIVSVIPNADAEESHTGRNVLIGGALCLGLLAMARFGIGGSKYKWTLVTRTSGGPTAVGELSLGERILRRLVRRRTLHDDLTLGVVRFDDPIYNCTIQYLEDLARANGYLKEAATQCLDGIKNGSITRFSQIDSILSNVKISAR